MASKNYKKIELEIRELVQQARNGTVSIYEIATRCVALLNASDSYATAVGIKPDCVIERLNGYLRDFAVDLETVVTLLQHRPNREQWNKPLLDLYDEVAREIKADREPTERRERRSVKLKDLEAVEAQLKEKDAEIRKLKADNERLIAANEKLTERVAKMDGQLMELRRLHKEPVAA